MPEREDLSPLVITIPSFPVRSKRENAAGRGKKRPRTHFFQGGQVCWSSFAADKAENGLFQGRSIRGKEKNAPGDVLRMR